MYRILAAALAASMVIANCDCSDNGDDTPTGPTPPDTGDTLIEVTATIDSALWGVWHLYDQSENLIDDGFLIATPDTITIADTIVLTSRPDPDPQFANALAATNGQIYLVPACDSCPNSYLYDYTLMYDDSVLYLLPDSSSTPSAPISSTPGVFMLMRSRGSIDTTELADIVDSLWGVWDLYDSTGNVLVQSAHLTITADSIVRTFLNGTAVVFKGRADPFGDRGYTLVGHEGQIYKDYHWETYPDAYLFDYALLPGSGTMYFLDETSSTATVPNGETDNAVILKRQ
ncbi:MAG: hypothetical protein GF331_17370 [Chitinivibrionales bacterium]|nr:hypothetical protein [Chitinivibrionales bacterium]